MAGSAQAEIPSQLGRSAVVTGATGGLGYETALALAKAGAEVMAYFPNKSPNSAPVPEHPTRLSNHRRPASRGHRPRRDEAMDLDVQLYLPGWLR
jgi:NAD(P)-dependent dehydrogenase (short-subunit alcohol dehydrogenase family)